MHDHLVHQSLPHNHDYRDIRDDVDYVRNLIEPLRTKYSDVSISFCIAAARHLYRIPDALSFVSPLD